jgi:hypothetical protein
MKDGTIEVMITLLLLRHIRKIAKATIKFIMSVRLSVRMEHLGSLWIDFYEIWYLCIFQTYIEKIQFSLKSDRNDWYFTRRPMYIFERISLSFS